MPDFSVVPPEIASKAHRDLAAECGFQYNLARSNLRWMELSFYPQDTWLCRLELDPQEVRTRRSKRSLNAQTSYYFVFRPSDQDMPIMPLGNDSDWVLRANKHYGLALSKPRRHEDDLNIAEVEEIEDPATLNRLIEYLHFYYNFTRYAAYMGGPMKFRVPRRLEDLEFSGASSDDRCQIVGALWRFLDARGTGQIQPAIGTVICFITRCHADVPIQVASSLWRLRISLSLRSGHVRLYGRVPFFHSPDLVPPPAAEVKVLPTPHRLFYWEPWLLVPARVRAAVGALTYFILAISWLVAACLSLGYALALLFHPLLVARLGSFLSAIVPVGWGALWWCAAYSIVLFAAGSAFVFQFDGVLNRAARTAPGVLRAAYHALDRLQKLVWDWFKPKLESPAKKGGTAALWLLVTSIFLILSFTTLQVASDPAGYADDVAGQRVLRTFMGHATIAFPGVPYLLGALNLDPLEWLKDPDMRSATVLGFRVMMLIVVFRAFWKLLGYTSPRILSRDNRRLEHEIAKLRKSGRHRYNQS